MSEYGHQYSQSAGTFLDAWGAGPYVLRAYEHDFRFEDSERFGPIPITRKGDVKSPGYFGEQSLFWHYWTLWKDQGRRVAEDGVTCIFEFEGDRP